MPRCPFDISDNCLDTTVSMTEVGLKTYMSELSANTVFGIKLFLLFFMEHLTEKGIKAINSFKCSLFGPVENVAYLMLSSYYFEEFMLNEAFGPNAREFYSNPMQ